MPKHVLNKYGTNGNAKEGLGKVHEASALHKEPQTTKQSCEWAWEEWLSQVNAH